MSEKLTFLFSKKTVGPWILIILPICHRIYQLIDFSSNVEYVMQKRPKVEEVSDFISSHPIAIELAFIVLGFIWLTVLVKGSNKGTPVTEPEAHPNKSAPDGTNTVPFFVDRENLDMRSPLSEIFKGGNEVHACFLSGEGIFASHSQYIGFFKRLILPHPEGSYVQTFQNLSNAYPNFRKQIVRTTEAAKQNHVPIKWFPDFIGTSLLFCNPDRPDGWVQIGPILPCAEPAERQHYRIEKALYPTAFSSVYKTFKALWDTSREPTDLSPWKLTFKFDPTFCEKFDEFDGRLFNGNRTRYWVEVKNTGSSDLLTTIYVEKFEVMPNEALTLPRPVALTNTDLEYPTSPFRISEARRLNLVPGHKEPVNVLSSNNAFDFIRIEGDNLDIPHHYENSYRVTIAAFAQRRVLARANLLVRRDLNKRLEVTLEEATSL